MLWYGICCEAGGVGGGGGNDMWKVGKEGGEEIPQNSNYIESITLNGL